MKRQCATSAKSLILYVTEIKYFLIRKSVNITSQLLEVGLLLIIKIEKKKYHKNSDNILYYKKNRI